MAVVIQDTFSGSGTLVGYTNETGHGWTAGEGSALADYTRAGGLLTTPTLAYGWLTSTAAAITGSDAEYAVTFSWSGTGSDEYGIRLFDGDGSNGFLDCYVIPNLGTVAFTVQAGGVVFESGGAFDGIDVGTVTVGEHTLALRLSASGQFYAIFFDGVEIRSNTVPLFRPIEPETVQMFVYEEAASGVSEFLAQTGSYITPPTYPPEAEDDGLLKLTTTSAASSQIGAFNSDGLAAYQSGDGIVYFENDTGSTLALYNPTGTGPAPQDIDWIITTNGAQDYSGRSTERANLKLRIVGKGTYAGFLVLVDHGKNAGLPAPTAPSWQRSCGTLISDNWPENATSGAYPLQPTRQGVLIQFLFGGATFAIDGNFSPLVDGYAQEVTDVDGTIGAIAGFPAQYDQAGTTGSSYAMPTGSYIEGDEDSANQYFVEFDFDTDTGDLFIYGIDPLTYERLGEIYPAGTPEPYRTDIADLIAAYHTPGTPVAGHVRARSGVTGFEVLNFAEAPAPPPPTITRIYTFDLASKRIGTLDIPPAPAP